MKLLFLLLATTIVHATSSTRPMTPDPGHEIPEIGKKREINSKGAAKKAYKRSKFEPCGNDQQNWEPVNGKSLIRALVVKTSNGFAPGIEGDPSAFCEVLVVDEKDDILGNLRPVGLLKKIATYSIIPGEMIGIPKAMFFLAPNFDPKKPPQFFPATCSMQDAKPQIVLSEPTSSDTELIPLAEEKLKPEPLPTSDAGDA